MSKNIAIEIPVKGQSRTLSGTIRYTGYGFLLVFYSNFVPKTRRFFRYSTSKAVTLKTGLGSVKVIENVTIR